MLKTSKARGFTLIELMITLVVLAIIIGIAVPAMGQFTKKQAVRSTADELLMSLVYARNEALKESKKTYVLPDANNWNTGWCVTPDSTGCKSTTLLRSFTSTDSNIEINAGSFNLGNPIVFSSKGLLKSAAGSETTLKVKNTQLADSEQRCITLSKTGRATVISCPE